MPGKAMKPCLHPGCRALVQYGSYCDKHRREVTRRSDERRGSSAERGYGTRWQKARATYLKSHPLCVQCLEHGRVVTATVVDHVVPHRGDQRLFWDTDNWQSLCKRCHDKKTASGR